MRIAVTTSILEVPPTYFVVDHARLMRAEHDFRVFSLAARLHHELDYPPVTDSLGLTSLPWSARRNLAPLAAHRMTSAIRRYSPDVVHQHFGTWSGPAISAAGSLGVPLVTTVHGYDVFAALGTSRGALARWHRRNVQASASASARVLAVSRFLADRAIAAGFDSRRVQVHYQGIDTDVFTPPATADDSAAPIVLFVGSVSERKGTAHLVEASRAMAASVPHELIVIGRGPLQQELTNATRADSHIRLLGQLGRNEIRGWLQRATVLALPTRKYEGWQEAAGLVLLEAQASGTPVVAYDSGGTAEMVEAGTTGLLVQEGDIAGFRESIAQVLALGGAEYARMSEAARKFVVSQRSLQVSAQQLLDHYADVPH